MQKDPDPGVVQNPITLVNKYTYVGNNPIMRADSSGKNWLGDAFVVVVAIVAAVYLAPVAAAVLLGGGALGGLLGAIAFYDSAATVNVYANDLVRRLSFSYFKEVFPLSNISSFTLTVSIGGFVYNQYNKPCPEGDNFNWKTNKCEPSSIQIPIYSGTPGQ